MVLPPFLEVNKEKYAYHASIRYDLDIWIEVWNWEVVGMARYRNQDA